MNHDFSGCGGDLRESAAEVPAPQSSDPLTALRCEEHSPEANEICDIWKSGSLHLLPGGQGRQCQAEVAQEGARVRQGQGAGGRGAGL